MAHGDHSEMLDALAKKGFINWDPKILALIVRGEGWSKMTVVVCQHSREASIEF